MLSYNSLNQCRSLFSYVSGMLGGGFRELLWVFLGDLGEVVGTCLGDLSGDFERCFNMCREGL